MENLVLQILLAILGGAGLFWLTLLCGNGAAAVLRLPIAEAGLLPVQYLFGIATVSALAFLWLFAGVGPLISLLAVAGLAYAGRGPKPAWAHAKDATVYGAPLALLLAFWIGLQFHGPSATLGGSPIGDTVWYAARAVFMVRDPAFMTEPFAEGYGSSLLLGPRIPMIIGAAMIRSGLADPFLFLAVTMTLFMGLWLAAIVLQALRGEFDTDHGAAVTGATLLTCIALIMAAPGNLYWIFESPPVSVVLPLGAIPLALLARSHCSLRTLLWVATAWLLFLCQSKLTAFSFMGPALLLPFILIIGARLGRGYAWGAIGILGTALVIICLLLVQRYQGYIGMTGLNKLSWVPVAVQTVPGSSAALTMLNLLTYAAFAALTWRLEWAHRFRLGLLLPSLSAVILALYIPTTAIICYKTTLIFVALTVMARVRRLNKMDIALALLAAGGLLLKEFDAAALRGAVADLLFAGMLLTPALLDATRVGQWRPGIRAGLFIAPAALSLLAVVALLTNPLKGYIEQKVHWVYSPDTYKVYDAVNRLTPPDALIFTDQTGASIDFLHGWNSYPGMGRRQTYVSNWYEVPPLGIHPEKVARRLRINQDILAGRLIPEGAGLSRTYPAYYAVVGPDKPILGPIVYANPSFRLYRIAN